MHSLTCHPDEAAGAAIRVTADAQLRSLGVIELRYRISGALRDLVLPTPADQAFVNGLWRSTCFEAFIGGVDEPGYVEFNFSPSRQWAAFCFELYREGRVDLRDSRPPAVAVTENDSVLELRTALRLADWPIAVRPRYLLRIGLAAVIEQRTGGSLHFALAHPQGAPDFHHADSFALALDMKAAGRAVG
ncbi:MAG: DOMON-like domain-containing protein [Steroidobacteraceae bacterium]